MFKQFTALRFATILAVALAASSTWAAHDPVALKGVDGKELGPASLAPYSPKQTCGECHDYAKITNGYHFQQGRTDGTGAIVISDDFNPQKPWILSTGMYGKW